jgi:RHS repeat-associated protein
MKAHRTLLFTWVTLFVLGQVWPSSAMEVVSTAAQQPPRSAVRSPANASVTGCAALTLPVFLPLIMRGVSNASAATTGSLSQADRVAAAADFASASAFLYSGNHPHQMGMAAGVIDPLRAAMLRGQVCDRSGNSIAGVQITVLNHSEYGNTLTGADGIFDLTVNGGGLITIVYTKTGYLPAQRQVQAPWQDYAWLPDIVMLPLDAQVTTINLNTAGMQVARGSLSTDVDGARRATLLIPQGTHAELVLSGGVTQTITNLHLRATEYTVGNAGPLAMPAQLPPSSGYTYALEYSVDEGLAAGATDIRFSQPLFHYVENFLNFPIGTAVPVGYYDKTKATWMPSDNGRVIKILSITGGLANLDTDGDGVSDNGVALGVTDVERQRLASLYAAGQSLWRVPITHFTPWDCNWPYGPPSGAAAPSQKSPSSNPPPDEPDCQGGSIIECQSQVLGEEVTLSNAPYSLNYRSDRVPGRTAAYTLDIPLSSSTVPTSLLRIELEVFIAGQRFTQQFSPALNQHTTFTWDGKDAYGRTVVGEQRTTTRVGYVYGATYQEPAQRAQAFAALSGIPFTANRARQEVTLWQVWQGTLGTVDARVQGLGGWSLNVHHVYDPRSKTLYLGDGTRRSTESLGAGVINTFAGGGSVPGIGVGDGGPATQAELGVPSGIAVGPDGSVYIAEWVGQRVRRVDASGIITTVAGTGTPGFSGDGGPATSAMLADPSGVAVAPDGTLYIADRSNHRIRRVDANGIITTVAGTGAYGFSGDGGPATLAQLDEPWGVALGPDGSLYIADKGNNRVRRVGPDGIITTVAGNGIGSFGGDGGPATQANLSAWRVAVGPDGSLYIMDYANNRVRRVGPDGLITTVAGNGTAGFSGDGGPATAAQISWAEDIALGPDGGFYIADRNNQRVRWVGSDGIISTVAGKETNGFSGDGGLAIRAQLDEPIGLALGPDGSLYIADSFNQRVRRVAPMLPGGSAGDILIPSDDAREVYIFSSSGRHLQTLNALTGAVLYQFAYDSAFRLTSVTDGRGNVTTIPRDVSGNPTAIVGPYGQQTTLTLDANGYLVRLTNPASESIQLASTSGGLLTSLTDARGNAYHFTYDSLGRLTRDDDPAGGFKTLARVAAGQAYTVTLSTALNRTTTYQVTNQPNGDQDRLNTQPDGTLDKITRNADSTLSYRYPDGRRVAITLGPDPRWGMLSALDSSATVTTPNGLRVSLATTRTATLTDTGNLFSLSPLVQNAVVNGRAYTSTFTAANRTITETTPEKRSTITTIDAQGRPVLEQVSGLLATVYTYDSHGRLSTVTQGSGAETRVFTYTYNSDGYLATITDPVGHTTNLAYDAAGRVTTETLPGSRVIGYAYDPNGNVTAITPPGRPVHTFGYTPVDLMSAYTPPNVSAVITPTLYAYNVDRQLTRSTRPDGQRVDVGYDSAGRQNAVTIARGTTTYVYDPATGNPATISAPGGIGLAYTFDGALWTGATWSGPVTGSVNRAYDNNFRVISTSVNGGQVVAFQYDQDNLLTQAGVLTLTYHAQTGLLTGSVLGSVADTIGYNGFAEALTYTAAYNGTSLYNVQRARDPLGRITVLTETIGGVTDVYGYVYDLAGRLIQVKKNGATIASYTYDSNDNRLSFTGPGGTLAGTYDNQDRLTQYGSATYGYTANGELYSKTVSGQTTSYQYDALGNLMQVTLPGGTQIAYLVDGNDRRIGKRVNGTLAQGFLYLDGLRPIAELDGSNGIVSRFVYATRANVPDYMIKGGVTYRVIADALGSPRLVVNTVNGLVIQRMDYDAFGAVINDTNPGFQPFGFGGGLYDRDTKLVRFGARDYDAETGRWTAKDPILFSGGQLNLYAYVRNDPINLLDSDGKDPGSDLQSRPPDPPAPKPAPKPGEDKQCRQPPPPPVPYCDERCQELDDQNLEVQR